MWSGGILNEGGQGWNKGQTAWGNNPSQGAGNLKTCNPVPEEQPEKRPADHEDHRAAGVADAARRRRCRRRQLGQHRRIHCPKFPGLFSHVKSDVVRAGFGIFTALGPRQFSYIMNACPLITCGHTCYDPSLQQKLLILIVRLASPKLTRICPFSRY